MINLFKRIRKSLLLEQKMFHYLKYAVGEILLVVIGILIAVQINSWYQANNRIMQEKILLRQVKHELLNIYADVFSDFNTILKGHESHNNIIKYISEDRVYNDTMCFDFEFLKLDEYIYPKDAVYSKIKAEGIDIIRNDTIRSQIVSLYESQFPRLSRTQSFYPDLDEFFASYYQEHFIPNADFSLLFKRLDYENDTISGRIFNDYIRAYPLKYNISDTEPYSTIGYVPLDFEQLKKDPKFKILLKESKQYRLYKLGRYWNLRLSIKELIEDIDKTLVSTKP